MYPVPEGLVIDGEPYTLLETAPGRRMWETQQVPTERGDGGAPKPIPLDWHHGFGASKRYSGTTQGGSAPGHHDYSQNWDSRYEGLNLAAPKITALDVSTLTRTGNGFQLGGDDDAQLGGAAAGLGGGSYADQPQAITEFGDYLYVHADTHTYTIDPSTTPPSLVETRSHGTAARARSGDVFDNFLVVALGNEQAQGARSPFTTATGTQWEVFANIYMNHYKTGTAGRLFSAFNNRVFNILAGQDPSVSLSYLPPAGEAISDETDPIQSLAKFSRALVAGTKRAARTFDPDAGFQGTPLMETSRLSPSEFDGRGTVTIGGSQMLYATKRAVWWFRSGFRPVKVGPELMQQNESPYIGGEYGIPDFTGEYILWPIFFPDTGDSVIFWVRPREQNEPGVGPMNWQELLYLADTEVRVVKFWGGTSSVKPRVFFGAKIASNSERIGWVDVGGGGGPDPFDTNAVPAVSAVMFGSDDDLGTTTTIKDVESIRFPEITNANDTNFLEAAVSGDGGVTYQNLLTDQDSGPAITQTGFNEVFPLAEEPLEGRKLKVRLTITQAAAATAFLTIRGDPELVVRERPVTAEQVTTLLEVDDETMENVSLRADRIKAHVSGRKIQIEGVDYDNRWVKVVDVRGIEADVRFTNGPDRRLAMQFVFREVNVG